MFYAKPDLSSRFLIYFYLVLVSGDGMIPEELVLTP